MALKRLTGEGVRHIPLRRVKFYGTATNVESYLRQIRKNGEPTLVNTATHRADFVGRPPLILGGNPATGGSCWFCYAHSSYYNKVPEQYIIDSEGKRTKHINPEYKKYTEHWGVPKKDKEGNWINQSSPKRVILDENNHIKIVE